jgi:hypothetical protein
MRMLRHLTLAAVVLAVAASAWAQAAVTAADITRLENTTDEIAKLADTLKKTDPTRAAEVQKTLADLRDDVTYLKVKLRKDGVTRDEYSALRDKLETLRIKAQGDKVTAQPELGEPTARIWTVATGTEMDVRLQTPLNSGTATVEKRFEATTVLDLKQDNQIVIPAGTVVRGFVSSVNAAGKINRKGSLTLSFDEILVGKQPTKLRASVEQALDGKMAQDATKIGAGAAVGAIIGGLLGGGKGALLGVLVGGGGTIAATEGADVDLPAGTILRIRLDEPLEVRINSRPHGQ